MSELSSAGASVESLQPVRDTLEDYFVQQVTAKDVVEADRGLDAAVGAGRR